WALTQAAYATAERGAAISQAADASAQLHTGGGTRDGTPPAAASGAFEPVLSPSSANNPASIKDPVSGNNTTSHGRSAAHSTAGAASATVPGFSLLAAKAITADPIISTGSDGPGSSFKPAVSSAPVPLITSHKAVAPADRNKSQTQCHGRRDQIFV